MAQDWSGFPLVRWHTRTTRCKALTAVLLAFSLAAFLGSYQPAGSPSEGTAEEQQPADPATRLARPHPVIHPYIAVCVEVRPQPMLPAVLENIATSLLPQEQWPLQVFYGENKQFLLDAPQVQSLLQQKRLHLDYVGTDSLTHDGQFWSYDLLCKREDFWRRVRGEVVLLFQSDSAFCRPTDLAEYLEYDYVGNPWPDPLDCGDREQTKVSVGNGGISLRRRSLMLETVITYPFTWHGNRPAPNWPHHFNRFFEDVYFSCAMAKLGRSIPDWETAANFSAWDSKQEKPALAVHGFPGWGYQERLTQDRQWCPPATTIMEAALPPPAAPAAAPKSEEPKPAEAVLEEVKAEEVTAKEPKAEKPNAEVSKPDETKPQEANPVEATPEETKTDEAKAEEAKPAEAKTEESQAEGANSEEVKQPEAKPEDANQKGDAANQETQQS